MNPVSAIATYIEVRSNKMALVSCSHVFWLALCLSSSVACAHATTAIAVTTATSAYIGVDSKVDPDGTMCKLVVNKRVAVGMSGQLADKATNFSAARSVAAGLAESRGFNEVIVSVIRSVEPHLRRSMKWGFVNDPAVYVQKFQGKGALALLIVGIDDRGQPQIVYVAWTTKNGDILRLPISRFGKNAFDAIGAYDAFISYLSAHPEWKSAGAVDRIRKVLEIESAASPDMVGPPFSIIVLEARGLRWIQRSPCETVPRHGEPNGPKAN